MPGKREYPSPEVLLELAAKYQSAAAVAKYLKIPARTFRDHINNVGIAEQFKEACRQPRVLEVEDDHSQLLILQQENKELRAALATAHAEDVREAKVRQAIVNAVPSKEPRLKLRPMSAPKGKHRQRHKLVLLWSDLHAGEVVSSAETSGANEYNWEIMLRRHEELRRGVLSFADRFGPVDELVVCGLGDVLTGNIHQELAETNEMPLSECIVQAGMDGAEFLESFTDTFPVRFAGVTGNHGRFSHKPRSKGRYDNADWLCYNIMQQRLSKIKNITFEVPKPARYPVEVYNRRLLLLHGDGIRSTMVGVPWGGVIRFTALLENQYSAMGQPIDHFLMGHYHEANSISNRKILMNGSIKGVDEYSLERFGGGHSPTQLLVPFTEKWGLTGVHYIDLEPEIPNVVY